MIYEEVYLYIFQFQNLTLTLFKGSKTTNEEKLGGGLNEEGATSQIFVILAKSCILILKAPELEFLFDKILSTTSFCIKKLFFYKYNFF